MAQYNYKVRNIVPALLEQRLNEIASEGFKVLQIDFIVDQFNGNHFNVVFEKENEENKKRCKCL